MEPFPPPDFIPTGSAIEGIEVYAPAPPQEVDHRPVVEFNCPQCGAQTAFSATDGGLVCTHCDYYEPPHQEIVGKGAEEFEFTVETMARAAHGWGTARLELQCQNCGAYTTAGPDTLTHACPFCASNKVIQRRAPQDVLRPRFLIPFSIEAEACRDIARDWLGSSWMTPRVLQQTANVDHFNGVYLPFWTFDAKTQAQWQAEVAHTKTERYFSASEGKWKTRTKTVWKWESGQVTVDFDDLLVTGTTRLSPLLLGQVQAFDLRQLAPYEPAYLAGFQAQAYDLPLEAAWEQARHQMREATRQSCRRQASSSRIRNFSMKLDFRDETWRYILQPVYIAAYNFEGKTYQIMVNGQTGAIAGQRPADWTKVWLAIAGLLAPGVTLTLVGIALTLLYEAGGFIAAAGFMLFIVGLALGLIIFRKAQALDDA